MKNFKTSHYISFNKKANFNYFIEDQYEAGLVLKGWEVKSLRINNIDFSNSFIFIKNKEVFLKNINIYPISSIVLFKDNNINRDIKLLLKHNEINKLFLKIRDSGYTIIPISLFWKNNLIKIKIALAKGKKLYDKRQILKERDWKKKRKKFQII